MVMKFKGWRKAVQKAGRWFRRLEEGAELLMRNWHETERRKAAERRAKAAAAPSTVGISKWPGRGRRGGGVLPKRLKSGSGHHRLENCGPSNSRHKIAEDRPDFFTMLRYLPSAIVDALDTLYEPSVVFSQFLGSVSMTFFFFPFLASSSCLVFSRFSCLFFSFVSFFFFSLPCHLFPFLSFIFSSFLCSFFRLTCV